MKAHAEDFRAGELSGATLEIFTVQLTIRPKTREKRENLLRVRESSPKCCSLPELLMPVATKKSSTRVGRASRRYAIARIEPASEAQSRL